MLHLEHSTSLIYSPGDSNYWYQFPGISNIMGNTRIHTAAKSRFPPPPRNIWPDTFSLVINRHPFSRIVSLYHDKFSTESKWRTNMKQKMFKEKRSTTQELGNQETIITPEELIK